MFNSITLKQIQQWHYIAVSWFNEHSILHSIDSSVQTMCLLGYGCVSRIVACGVHEVIHHFSSAMTGT